MSWTEKEMLDYLERDERVGAHVAMITAFRDMGESKHGGHWYSVDLTLETANNTRADFTLSDMGPILEMPKAAIEQLPGGERAGIARNMRLQNELRQHYGISIELLKNGAGVLGKKIGVETVKTRKDASTGKGGFIRVIAVKPLAEITKQPDASSPASDIPF